MSSVQVALGRHDEVTAGARRGVGLRDVAPDNRDRAGIELVLDELSSDSPPIDGLPVDPPLSELRCTDGDDGWADRYTW